MTDNLRYIVTMKLIINGKEILSSTGSVAALAKEHAEEGFIAVSKNGIMIPRSKIDNTTVRDGDALDFLKAVGGG